jgi:mechanosensitive ion channel-like protein
MAETWSDLVWAALQDLNHRLVAVLPSILAMLTLVAVGLVAAWLAALLLRRLARAVAFDRRAEAWGLVSAMTRAGLRRSPSQLLAVMLFWAILALFLTFAVDALAIPGVGRVTDFVFAWVPRAIGAAVIFLVGWLVANFLGEGVLIAAVNAGVPEARLLARAVRWGVLLFASATAITHLGIGKEMVLVAFGITFGGLILALALAFGLGGRVLARQILERRLRHEPHPSETLTHL